MASDYLIEILLEAKDNAGAKIRALQRQVEELKASAAAQDLSSGLGDMADEADRAASSHRDLTQQQRDHQQAVKQSESDLKNQGKYLQEGADAATAHAESIGQINEQHKEVQSNAAPTEAAVKRVSQAHAEGSKLAGDSASAHNDLANAMHDTAGAADEVTTAQQKLAEKADEALGTFDDLSTSFRSGSKDLKTLRQDLQASGQELQSLSRRFKTTSDDARLLRDTAEEASAMAKNLSSLQPSSRQPLSEALGFSRARQDLDSLTRDWERFQQRVSQAGSTESPESQLTSRMFASRFGSVARRLPTESNEFQSAVSSQVRARQLAAPVASPVVDAQEKAIQSGDKLIQRMSALDAAAHAHTATNKELATGYAQVSGGLRKVWQEMDVGSAEARKFGSAMEDAAKKAKNVDLARSNSGIGRMAQDFAAATDNIGVKIISLSAELRGLRLVGLVGFLQPLLTGLMSLGGGFFSVASGAAQAAATIGGVFVSSLGQLIPMLSVGIAALMRLRAVFQAVQAAQAAQQEAFFQPNQGLITQLQNTNQLIEAEQNLKNAYYGLQDAQVQVKESQIQLTQARIDAIRNLQDLVLAEKSAELQSKESNLAVTQAEQQLRAAQSSGSQQGIEQAQLQLQGARIQQQQARIGVPRARQNLALAQGYGIAGSPGVLSATEGARQARLAVTQQQQAIAQAQRQMKITQLTLAQPASHMTSQQATLAYLMSQMSAPEKALFNVLNNFENQLRSPNSPLKKLTDYIIEPFTTAFTRLDALLNDKSFMEPMTKMAHAMGDGLQKIFGTMFGKRGTSFFETMANDATKSIPVITGAITGIMKVFEDIAKAAAPAMLRLSKDWENFWNTLDKKERTPQGQDRLAHFFDQGARWAEDFAKLASAIGHLFMALGHDAAPQGMKSVSSLTESIKDATTWIKTHGPEVTNFFRQTRQGMGDIGGVLLSLGSALLKAFNLASLQAFTTLLKQIVIPALTIVTNVIGAIVRLLTDGLNFQFKIFGVTVRPIADMLTAIATALFGIMALNKVVGVVSGLGKAFVILKGAMKGLADGEGFVGKLSGMFKGGMLAGKGIRVDGSELITASREMQKAADTMVGAAEKMKGAGLTQETAAGTEVTAATEQGTAATEEGVAAAELKIGGAGGAGILEGAGVGALGAGALATAGLALAPLGAIELLKSVGVIGNGWGPSQRTTSGTGLAALLGPVDKSVSTGPQNPGSLRFSSVGSAAPVGTLSSATNAALKHLQSGLSGVTSPSQLTTAQLQSFYNQALKIQQMPDITATQRRGLDQLVTQLNPVTAQIQKLGIMWGSTFSGINSTTGNVMQQVQQVLKQDLQNISQNLGTGTTAGAEALSATIQGAYSTVVGNTNLAAKGVQRGLAQINTELNNALKAMGGPHLTTGDMKALGPNQTMNWIQFQSTGSAGTGGHGMNRAEGGWNPATPGGMVYRAGEAGHDEVTLTTDPAQAPRQRMLLGQYLRRTPHMASGGSVYASPFGGANVTIGRTDMGVDADLSPGTPIGVIGNSRVTGVLPNWYQGQPFIWYQLTDGPDAGRYVYLAEQISGIPGVAASDPRATSSLRGEVGRIMGKGQRLAYYATSGTGIETGWATASGATLAQASGYGSSAAAGAPNSAGSSFRSFLSGLAHGVITGGTASAQITAPKVKGVSGALGTVAQSAVNLATTYANKFLSSFGLGSSGGGNTSLTGIAPGSWTQVAQQIAAKMGWGASEVSAWQGVEKIEDGAYSLTAKNPTSSAYGLAQFINGPSEYAQYGGNANTIVGQLTAMANYIKQRYGSPAAALAHEHAAGWYAGGGLLARRLRKSVMRFVNGGRAPWGGEPVSVVAHEGERISNPNQWGEVARLAGTTPSGLDHHLGYDTNSPRQSFDVGGTLTAGQGHNTSPKLGSMSSITGFLGNLTSNLFTMDLGSVYGSLTTIGNLFSVINQGFTKIGQLGGSQTQKQLSQIGNIIEAFADPNNTDSTLNMLAATFQRFQGNLATWVTGLSYTTAAIPAGRNIARIKNSKGVLSVVGGGDNVALRGRLGVDTIGTTGQTAADLLGERSLAEQQTYLEGESRSVASAMSHIKTQINTVSHSSLPKSKRDKAVNQLQSAYTLLTQQQEQLVGAINTNITQRYQQEQTYVQDSLNQVADIFQTQAQEIQTKQSGMQALGQFGQLPSVDQALAASSAQQIKALQPILAHAKKINDSDLVAQIEQQISQVQSTMTQALAQMVQDQLSAVEQTFQTQSAAQQAQQSTAQTLGQYSVLPGIDQAIVDTTNQHIAALQQVLAQANAIGNQSVATQVQQEIYQLQSSVSQMTAQMIQDAISGIQQQASTDQAKVSMMQTISQSMTQNASTSGQFAQAGALNLQALQLSQGSLQGQLQGYNSLLGQAITSGNQGEVATLTQQIDQLTAQLFQNDQAIQDNTAQVVQQTAQFIQSRGQFQTGLYGGLASIVNTIGQTTGFTDVGALKSLTGASNTSLMNTNQGLLGQLAGLGGGASGLASMLGPNVNSPQAFLSALGGVNIPGIESGQDQTWINTFEGLLNNLEQNTSAIATNNQQLAVLNGQLLQPQQWSTTAWTAFRSAIFSGMGNLLPQYQTALAGTGGIPTIAPVFNPVGGNRNSPTIGTLNINHAPTSQLDAQLIGEQLAFQASTAL